MRLRLIVVSFFMVATKLFSQCYWINNGANVILSNDSKVMVFGEYQNQSSGTTSLLSAHDSLYVKQLINNATISSNGVIYVDSGNWVNNNVFTANTSRVYIHGLNQQITGTNPTTFYDLYLLGNNTSGQKKLGNNITVQNKLFLNAHEIYLQGYTLTITNPATSSLQYSNGYITSDNNGWFVRATNTTQPYYFPMASESSLPPFRFRPINVTPSNTTSNTYKVNFRNTNPNTQSYDPTVKENTLCEVNNQYFYKIDRTDNTTPFAVQIFYNESADGTWETMSKWTDNLTPVEWKEQTPSNYTAGSPFSNVTATIQGSNAGTLSPITLAKRGPYVNLGNDTAICQGNSITIDAGNSGYNYQWSTGANTQQITVNTGGTYSVTVTNPANNCSSTDAINIQVIPTPTVDLGNDTSICQGSSLTLDAGNPGYNYQWSTGATTQQITVSSAGTYSVTVTYPSSACSGSDEITIQVIPTPTVDLGNDTSICQGSSLTLDAGNPGYDYQWSTGATTQQITVSSAGTYSVTVTTPSSNCSSIDNITIQILPLPDAQITSTNLSFCNNEANPTLQATPAGGVWSGQGINPTTGTINLASLTPGNYTITYTATNQCGSDKDSVLITVKESPSVSASSIGEHCQGANDGKAWVTIVGNNAPYSIVWSNGASTDTITMLIPGTYSVVVTGANGCKSGDTTIVNGSSDECYITHIFIPNIFSPNGDGNNDAFQVYGAGIKNIEIHIFDRWGIEVFSATTLNEKWDGTYKGKLLDPAVFTYYITVEFYNGDLKNFTGTVTLVR